MKPLDLFGTGLQSYSAVVTSQRRLNCFYDLRPDGDKFNVAVVGTPGTVLAINFPTGVVRGWRAVNDTLYVVAGKSVFSVNLAGTKTLLGTITSTSGYVSMADNGVEVIFVDGSKGYYITIATGVLSSISDGNFPNGATTVDFLNGRFFVEQAGTRQFVEGQSYAAATWTPFIFGTKENSSDKMVAVSVYNGLLILWGRTSMEFWQDVGAAPLTVSRVNGATQNWGLAAVKSKAIVDNVQVFLGARPEGGYQIAALSGYVPVPISTSDIDAIINKFSTVSDATALTYIQYGHPIYQITFPTGGRSFIYDMLSKAWSEVQTGVAELARHVADMSVVFNKVSYVNDYANGNVYSLSADAYTDNGVAIKRQVRTKHIRLSGNEFGIDELYLDMETGVGLQAGQGQDPLLMVQTSKDGGRTFGSERRIKLGVVGDYLARVIMRRFGKSRDFVFQFTMTDPVKFILTSGSAVVAPSEAANG